MDTNCGSSSMKIVTACFYYSDIVLAERKIYYKNINIKSTQNYKLTCCLYACGTLSVTRMGKHRLKVF